MSLSPREQEALSRIENRLAGSDPELAERLATFTRLTSGEAMPAREEMRAGARQARRPSAASTRLARAMALLWMLIAAGVIAVAVSLSGNGSGRSCVTTWPTACAGSAPAHVTQSRSRLPTP